VNGQGFCCDDNVGLRAGNDNPELFQYYYHSDHLGSTSLITDLDGNVVQHVEYVPFGEVFIEERNNKWNTPYLFNAKELDEETGLYYYGARYYDPRVSIWYGTDPMHEKYPVVSTYAYCVQNPLRFIDPDGRSTRVAQNEDGTYRVIGGDLNDKDYNIYVYTQDKEGNYTVQGQSIGVTTSITSFYNDSKNENGTAYGWMGTINTQDNSGETFLSNNIFGNTMTLDKYMANASLGEKYDFKSIGAGDRQGAEFETYVYRGTKVGTKDGIPVYTSARDVGNIAAGYVAGSNGIDWKEARIAFDLKQKGFEGSSTKNAEYWGWKMGYNNSTPHQRVTNFGNSLFGIWDMLKGLLKK
jgi:RHS repeat-associated protein